DEAEACLRALLRPGAGFVAGDVGLCGYKARHNLALVHQRRGRVVEAEAEWRAGRAGQPDLLSGGGGLGGAGVGGGGGGGGSRGGRTGWGAGGGWPAVPWGGPVRSWKG